MSLSLVEKELNVIEVCTMFGMYVTVKFCVSLDEKTLFVFIVAAQKI